MKKAAIIGLGNVLQGDYGAACYILEAVAEKTAGEEAVQICFMGDDPRFAGGVFYETDLSIVVGTLKLSEAPGDIHIWDNTLFQHNAAWLADENPVIERLLGALARADMAGGFPKKLIFIWIEPQITDGYEISEPARNAVSMAVQRIHKELRK